MKVIVHKIISGTRILSILSCMVTILANYRHFSCLRFFVRTFSTQIVQAKSSCNEALQELKHWMKPEKVITKNKNDYD